MVSKKIDQAFKKIQVVSQSLLELALVDAFAMMSRNKNLGWSN
ncbi:hypothetical protein [Lactococcus ileimucosae]